VRAAGIFIFRLVRGLNPIRALRRLIEKVPNLGMQKRWSSQIARAISSKVTSIVSATIFFGCRMITATESISSDLVISIRAAGQVKKKTREQGPDDVMRYSYDRTAESLLRRRLLLMGARPPFDFTPHQSPTHSLIADDYFPALEVIHHALEDYSTGK